MVIRRLRFLALQSGVLRSSRRLSGPRRLHKVSTRKTGCSLNRNSLKRGRHSKRRDSAKGLGIYFNDTSCAACHVAHSGAKRLPGGSGPTTEIRAGFLGFNNKFFPAPGGSLITTRAVGNAIPEIKALSDKQNVRDRFVTPSFVRRRFRGSCR